MKNQSSTVVFVNPVQRISPQGRDKQTFTFHDPKTNELIVTQNMNKTREFGVGSEYSFKYNPVTNRLETGLDKTIKNPFYGLEPSEVSETYGLRHEWLDILPTLVKQTEIKKQTWFEILDNTIPNYYTSEIAGGITIFNLTKSTRIPEQHNFLQKFSIILYDKPNRFSDDTPRGRLAIQLIKHHNKIAHNKMSVNSALHDFYISEENEAAMEKAKKQDVINEAVFNLVKLQKEGSDFINYQVSCLLTTHDGKPIVKGEISNSEIKRRLNEYIGDGNNQMENIEKFDKINSLLQNKEGRETLHIMYLIQQALNTGVMDMKDGYYVWHSKSGTPNMYKHINYDKLLSLLFAEQKKWNPEDPSVTNWYGDLYNEVRLKGIRFE